MIHETRKILHDNSIAISATCVRAPVFAGHSEAVHVEFTHPMSPDEARSILVNAPGVKVLDDPSVSLYPLPWTAAGSDDVYVGRIRQDASCPNGLAMWVVSDNVRKGAALNAIQIAEHLISKGWL
jgi:aspartate-semialdehyde dehydrogenase